MKHVLFYFLVATTGTLLGQTPSVLSAGKWHKISVSYDAVYKIDYNFVKSLGINPDAIDPRKIQLFTGDNGMLPQANSAPRLQDLRQVAMYMIGGEDGRFQGADYLLFYGEGPDTYNLPSAKGVFYYENNIYSDKNFYFISVGTTTGLRIPAQPSPVGSYPVVTEFDDFGYYETDQSNDLHSGRDWYGERFDSNLEYTIRFDRPGIIDGTPIKVVSNVMGRSFGPSTFQLSLNGVAIGTQTVPPVIDSPYSTIGAEVADTLLVNSSAVGASARSGQDVKIRFIKATTGQSVGYLDYLLFQSKRALSLYGDQQIFTSLKSLEQPVTRFSIANTFPDGMVWDVTDPFQPLNQGKTFNSGSTTFSAVSDALKKYIVLSNRNYLKPKVEGVVTNQNLHGMGSVDLLIISAPDFRTEAERFAEHRQAKSAMKSVVVTTSQVYHEFSGGKQDITALRDLVKYLYSNGAGIKHVLLFGRGSYDYKNHLSFNKNFVPIYQSRNSLSPLETYASDDYLAFLENHEGNWGESPLEQNTLDIGVGRIPVNKVEEAAFWVDKVIKYENQNWGSWRKEMLFVADDGDFNIHQSQANQMAETLETDHPEVNTGKIYVDAFQQVSTPSGKVSTEARAALNQSARDGAAIINFTGHGSELQWTQERILDQVSFDDWKTEPRYPFLVTATCEFGRNDDPGLISSAELSLFKKKSGSIGLVTTARPVNSSTNFTLNKAFYQYLFTKNLGKFRDWGSVFRDTKNNSMSGVSNRNFSLLGDPSMLPPLGSAELVVTDITNLTSGSDTLKALSRVRISGSVERLGIPDPGFEGVLTATLFDKLASVTTLGDENPPFNFTIRDNAVFRGQASIRAGEFEIEFIIPKSIDLVVGAGKLSLYGFSSLSNEEAMGGESVPKVGALEQDPGIDTSGPLVEVFVGDTTFINGGLAGTNSRIVAILADESGIDISNFNPQNDIIANLDDTLTVHLNKYYQCDIDNFTRGKVSYPIDGIAPGFHTLSLTATDTFGNTATASVTFYVSDQMGIQIEQWLNYPNPFSSSTIFHFKHNRSGEDLEVAVTVFDRMGKQVLYNTYQIYNSSYKVDLPSWEGTAADGTKLVEGLYLMKLSLRSLEDGTKNEKIAKVILVN